ncbi:MAG: hypothetical protein IKR92_01930 [Alphaproteobacteria bacterium]|nr:hypothetical protein [Alphaproteobacteria bacterium]
MKLFYVTLMLAMQAMSAHATILPKEQPREAKLYEFSEELINAVENCSEYATDFSVKETPYAHLGDFMGKMPSKSKFEIYYHDKDICRMRVRFIALGQGETRFNCRLNDKQRAQLVQAMRDKSTEEYVVTLPTEDEADCSGCSSAVTFSGNLFDTTLAMLKPKVCAELHIMPTRDEIEAARVYNKQFSEDFRATLKKCIPAKRDEVTGNLLDGVEILGKVENSDKCRLKFAGFEMTADPNIFKSVTTIDDLQRTLLRQLDDAKYDYENKYDGTGMLFGLHECRKGSASYNAGENIFMHGNIQVRNGLNAKRSREICEVVLKNTVEIANVYYRDYSMKCNVPLSQIDSLTATYAHLLETAEKEVEEENNGVFYAVDAKHTPETQRADTEILAKVRDYGYCHNKLPLDPIKVERDDFTYSNSLPTK